jgi:AcrR family transcriptional regulator
VQRMTMDGKGVDFVEEGSKTARAAAQRARIIATATALYAEKGYAGTRMEDVAAHARMSKRTIYSHFRTMADLRFAVYQGAVIATLGQIASIIQDETVVDHLEAGLERAFDLVVRSPDLSRVVVFEFQLAEPRNIARRQEVVDFFVGLISSALRDDYEHGRTPYLPNRLSLIAFLGVVEGLAVHLLNSSATDEAKREAVDVAKRIYRGIYPWRPGVHATRDPSEFK